jgi:short-subunit dehydrogenase
MSRLTEIIKTNELEGKRVLITGCGYKPLKHIFYDWVTGNPSHDAIFIEGQEMKLNLGAATAAVLASKGATVHMVSHTKEKLNNLKTSLDNLLGINLEYSAVNLMDNNEIKSLAEELPKDKTLFWVNSLGLGGGSYKVKDDNPYLGIMDIPEELMKAELNVTLKTHVLTQALLPIFYQQKETRICYITSMSAIRTYTAGGTHATAKAALDMYAKTVGISEYKNKIFVSKIRSGAIDTGMYDNPIVREAVIKGCIDDYNGIYREHECYAPPTSVGNAIANVLISSAHIPSVNLVAKGQNPHEGS